MGQWKDAQRKALEEERALIAECAAEQAKVHSLN